MPTLALVIADSFLTGSILTLVLPLAVLIAIAVWYVLLFNGGMGQR